MATVLPRHPIDSSTVPACRCRASQHVGVAMTTSRIDASTQRAYRETDYRVATEPPFVLRIGTFSPELAALHGDYAVTASAFITACNPRSKPLDVAENARRQKELAGTLAETGWRWIDGVGCHPSNGWPGEPSYLVPGLPRESACALGRQFEQNAIVWCGADAVPELILLR